MSNDGKEAEGYIRDALKLFERKSRSTFVRLYDSKSAGLGKGGNVIPPQPADFIGLWKGLSFLLEVKSSERYDSLAQATIREVFSSEQMLGVRLWSRCSGAALCAFYSIPADRFEIWDGRDILVAYDAPPRQRKLTAKPLRSDIQTKDIWLYPALLGALSEIKL
jgi:hypothetical protein